MRERVSTPASSNRRPTVAVLGAGIAGLTAAHELVERGFEVTVYEPRPDERSVLDKDMSPECWPPIKLGGLAASQYSKVGPGNGDTAELRPFPGRRGTPKTPERPVAGEHGFRFFPSYYLHIWDLFQRIPVYQRIEQAGGKVGWQMTSRTVMDNVRRVITQGTTIEGKPSLVFPREAPRSLAELLTAATQLGELGFSTSDIQTFAGRLAQYLVTSPLRRARELQNISAYDFFIGRDARTVRRFYYTPHFEAQLLEMPRVLAAFDSRWGDARTNLTTYLQLQLQMDRRDDKADGVLNGPTTEAWFDHWYRHLVEVGVRFVQRGVDSITSLGSAGGKPPHLRPRVQVQLADGTRLAPDYVVVAVDAPAAERITAALRSTGTGGTVAGLGGFSTSVPPPGGPLQATATRPSDRRDPYSLNQMGRVPWDRFQTLAGIQYFFDTEFQLLRGHMYYSGTEWGLSSINQSGMWEKQPYLVRDGHVSVLSVDIGDFNTPSRHLVDASGRGKAARDCTADEIAEEVWRQIVHAVTSDADNVPEALLPWPAWYALDRNLRMTAGPAGRAVRNDAPYLVPIVGDWQNRPGCDPWNPHGSSWTTRATEGQWQKNLEQRSVWQARHGGSEIHHNSVVFAGTWTKTFTRMTSMEAACESARHAVNAILDHYVWVESGGVDRRENTTLNWKMPFGFIDQGFSSPIRMPSPAGDYCYVFDIENREPLETRALRNLDSQYCQASLPHPLDLSGVGSVSSSEFPVPAIPGGQPMTSSPPQPPQHLLSYLQAWRQYLEQTAGVTTPSPPAPWGVPAAPPVAPLVPVPAAATASPDYVQQLLGHLQAWRQYLEQTISAVAPRQPHPANPPSAAAAASFQAGAQQPADPPLGDLQPGPGILAPASEKLETVVPRHGDYSQFSHIREPKNQGYELYSEPGSRYQSSRCFPSGALVEPQWTSAYEAPSSTPPPVSSGPPASLHSDPATRNASATSQRTEREQEGPAASDARPEELELIKPIRDFGR